MKTKYPSTEQFRNIVRLVRNEAAFEGLDDDGDPIYNLAPEYPIIDAVGTVKLHGTNAGVSYDIDNDECYAHSRKAKLDESKPGDLYGFVGFFNLYKEALCAMLNSFKDENHLETGIVTMYGEWAGSGIQSGVGISKVPKKLYVFALRWTVGTRTEWFDFGDGFRHTHYVWNEHYGKDFPIKLIDEFPTYNVTIDFANPELCRNELVQITNQVEKECPVAKAFGVDNGIGEGVVYTFKYKNKTHRFKVKGEKHSVSNVKTLAPIDTEKLNSINEFVEYAVTENRVLQAMQETNADSKQQTGDVMRWIANDIIKEESDTLEDNNLEWKDVAKKASDAARRIFFSKIV